MFKGLLVAGLSLLALQGCATKNFGTVQPVTEFEMQTLSCREIALEQARLAGFRDHINKENETDGRDFLAFFGDFGIGNQMALYNAEKTANGRGAQLDLLASQRGCQAETSASAPKPPPAN